eukprot:TRINITY_DN3158_c0_g4_i1.p2 TRINITY_DN3158_c0_g4~~TRINITY_DN3158_c0_g4_i1.p2  ORF type:complete len:456 (+),score=151.72 TRINITY_DN3158_c0_g4_i1:47-1414(+)
MCNGSALSPTAPQPVVVKKKARIAENTPSPTGKPPSPFQAPACKRKGRLYLERAAGKQQPQKPADAPKKKAATPWLCLFGVCNALCFLGIVLGIVMVTRGHGDGGSGMHWTSPARQNVARGATQAVQQRLDQMPKKMGQTADLLASLDVDVYAKGGIGSLQRVLNATFDDDAAFLDVTVPLIAAAEPDLLALAGSVPGSSVTAQALVVTKRDVRVVPAPAATASAAASYGAVETVATADGSVLAVPITQSLPAGRAAAATYRAVLPLGFLPSLLEDKLADLPAGWLLYVVDAHAGTLLGDSASEAPRHAAPAVNSTDAVIAGTSRAFAAAAGGWGANATVNVTVGASQYIATVRPVQAYGAQWAVVLAVPCQDCHADAFSMTTTVFAAGCAALAALGLASLLVAKRMLAAPDGPACDEEAPAKPAADDDATALLRSSQAAVSTALYGAADDAGAE